MSGRITNTQPPPLVAIGRYASSIPNIISLGQGAPYYHPPPDVFTTNINFADTSLHRYSSDPGIIELRKAITRKDKDRYGVDIDPDTVVVTPGANQAFFNALLTATDSGDEIILISPYYFNHYMAATMLNLKVTTVPLDSATMHLDGDRLQQAITPRTKVIVLVNPGNPTGKVFSKQELLAIKEVITDKNILLFSDETYEYFTYAGNSHINAASLIGSQVITICSFSKTFGVPGWRLGYYYGPHEFIQASLKVQDTIGICAPMVSQLLGVTLLNMRHEIIPRFHQLMENNFTITKDLVEEIPWLESKSSAGAYYVFPKQTTGKDTGKLAYQLIDELNVYMVPGGGFGTAGTDHFRISFANVSEKLLKDAFARLRSFHI